MTDTNQHHFFAASASTWATTTNERSLQALLKLMDKEKQAYNLYMVPVSHDTDYDIEWYMPKVKGTKHLGTFTFKQGARK